MTSGQMDPGILFWFGWAILLVVSKIWLYFPFSKRGERQERKGRTACSDGPGLDSMPGRSCTDSDLLCGTNSLSCSSYFVFKWMTFQSWCIEVNAREIQSTIKCYEQHPLVSEITAFCSHYVMCLLCTLGLAFGTDHLDLSVPPAWQ